MNPIAGPENTAILFSPMPAARFYPQAARPTFRARFSPFIPESARQRIPARPLASFPAPALPFLLFLSCSSFPALPFLLSLSCSSFPAPFPAPFPVPLSCFPYPASCPRVAPAALLFSNHFQNGRKPPVFQGETMNSPPDRPKTDKTLRNRLTSLKEAPGISSISMTRRRGKVTLQPGNKNSPVRIFSHGYRTQTGKTEREAPPRHKNENPLLRRRPFFPGTP